MTQLTINLFGSPQIFHNDRPVKPDTKKAVALLVLLLCQNEHQLLREQAAVLLWPQYDQKRSQANLRRALSSLRKTIGSDRIIADRERVQLLLNETQCDLLEFKRMAQMSHINNANLRASIDFWVSLYQKEFLAGFFLKDSIDFEEWLVQEKLHIRQMLDQAIEAGLQTLAAQQQESIAISLAQAWMNSDRTNEIAHQQLIRLYRQQGKIDLARKQYEMCVDVLEKEFGTTPQAETVKLFEAIQQNDNAQLVSVSAPNQTPSQITKFIGREEEMQFVQTLLDQETGFKLIALEGMGGIGKTTMAIELAIANREQYPDGILWAQADKHDLPTILSLFAEAYGRDVSDYQDVESRSQIVRDMLRNKKAILILDNVEDSEQVEPLLPTESNCAVIVTTRKRGVWLLQEAVHVELRPFRVDTEESLQMFQHRLGAVYVLSHKDVLLQIADLLGHVPLAVDLAASRLAFEPGWEPSMFYDRLKKKRINEGTQGRNGRLTQTVTPQYTNQCH